MLGIVNYSFTDPLIEFTKSATFRLRAEGGYWLESMDTENQIIESQLKQLRGHLKRKAEQGIEVFRFFESQLEEYGIAILATVLLYQLEGLLEIELACSSNAKSSRFMLTTMHHFDPPFSLSRLGMTRLADFATANYPLLERFIRLGASKVGIDSRFGSTSGGPKIRPVPVFSSGIDTNETVDSCADDLDSSSEDTVVTYYRAWWIHDHTPQIDPWIERSTCLDIPRNMTVEQELEKDYNGYQSIHQQVTEHATGVNDNSLEVDRAGGYGGPLLVKELHLWLDETPENQCDPLVSLLQRTGGVRNLEINLFPSIQSDRQNELAEIMSFSSFARIFQAQKETLEALTVRISLINGPQLQIPSLRHFNNLRHVHLFYGGDTHRTFESCMNGEEPYFKFMFPQQLEYLRMDIFKDKPCLEFIVLATQVPTAWFPNLKIVLGVAKDKSAEEMMQAIGDIWSSLPYSQDVDSGEWKVDIEHRSGSNSWRKSDMNCVPVKILAHGTKHTDVFCSENGWNGPFQKQDAFEMAYSSKNSEDPQSNDIVIGEPKGEYINTWNKSSEEPDVIELGS
ncbi:hypothetical protein TWF506_003218 [Arthrobotrys conoides]|uniref:Uncharacterized protein n=1 Tax=Arthrobotrys conoides TaxID=74498 RepID=A0AAN8NN09_9PEZI